MSVPPCSEVPRVATLADLVERDADPCGGFGVDRGCVQVEAVTDLRSRFGRFRIVARGIGFTNELWPGPSPPEEVSC